MNRRSSPRRGLLLAALGLTLLLALGAGGCGGGGDSSTSEGSSSQSSPSARSTDTTGKDESGGSTQEDESGDSDKAEPDGSAKPSHPSIAEEEEEAPDQSIQSYGSEAAGGEKEEVVSAMRSFFRALASADYATVCADLTTANREQLQQYLKLEQEGSGSCASILAKILSPATAPEAKKAAVATISRVRIGEGNAFILFRPAGGKLSYFVMKDEDGAWQATSLAAGTPLSP